MQADRPKIQLDQDRSTNRSFSPSSSNGSKRQELRRHCRFDQVLHTKALQHRKTTTAETWATTETGTATTTKPQRNASGIENPRSTRTTSGSEDAEKNAKDANDHGADWPADSAKEIRNLRCRFHRLNCFLSCTSEKIWLCRNQLLKCHLIPRIQ